MVLFAGMVGFGAMGKTNGFDVQFTTLTSFFVFPLPGGLAGNGDYGLFSLRNCFGSDAYYIYSLHYHDGDTISAVSSKGSQSELVCICAFIGNDYVGYLDA